jgi:hypothetical protein
LSDTKILVSGCGITYSKQKIKTWSNILQLTGCTIVDVGGPAVSNQWIINKTLLELQLQPDIKTAVVQLSSLGKLDVYVDQKRIDQLVIKDPLRNFIIDENFEGDSFFPTINEEWKEVERQTHKGDDFDYHFISYIRNI